jgi:surfactin synthase thioesterase subunit
MSHPSLGLPPPDPTAGRPAAARRLRRQRDRIARLALEAALRRAPSFRQRYDELALRRLLRDMEAHVEQLARALETADSSFVTNYAEWLVPIYRRRHVPMKDFAICVEGLRDAVAAVLSGDDLEAANAHLDAWRRRLIHHRALPGDHKGNAIVRFFWKGAGVLDDSIV